MPVKFQDYYEILGVSRNVSEKDIRAAYLKLAKKYHPDRNNSPQAEEKFKRIQEAYQVLKDPETRKRYNTLGRNWKAGQDFSPPNDWFKNFGGFNQNRKQGDSFDFGGFSGGGGFSDFFDLIFGRKGGFSGSGRRTSTMNQQWSARGDDQETEITLPLEDVYHNAKKSISLDSMEPSENGFLNLNTKRYDVKIPQGTTNGSRIRLSKQGGRGTGGGTPGDLYLKVRISPHPRFRVREYDLELDLPITPWEAALGSKIRVPTLDSTVTMTLPPGTQSEHRMRLRGKGLVKRGGSRGDLLAIINIMVPTNLTAKERDLLKKLADTSSFNPREK